MGKPTDLIDTLSDLCGCDYLSQLHGLSPENPLASMVSTVLQSMSTEDYPDAQWKETLTYILGTPLSDALTAQKIKEYLLTYLSPIA